MSQAVAVGRPTVRPRTARLFSFPVALGALLALLVVVAVRKNLTDPDLWWHLRNAQELAQTHRFALADSYSFTAAGTARVPQEWLAELAFYGAYRAAGLYGVFFLTLVACEAILLGIFLLAYRASGDIKNSFVVTVFAEMLATVSTGPRTLLFGWLCLIVLLYLLERFRQRPRVAFFIPGLFLIWVNTHASWLMGMLVFAIILGCGLVEGRWGQVDARRWSPSQLRALLASFAASAVALLINPTGYRAVWYPLDLGLRQKLNTNFIQEWASVDFHTPRGQLVMGVLLATLVFGLMSGSRWRLEELALTALAVYMGVTYSRLSFLPALLITPVLARRLKLLEPYRPERDKLWLNAAFLAAALAISVFLLPSHQALAASVAADFPEGATRYLKDNHIRGRILNEYAWGGFLIWNNRDLPVFVDGRAEVYEYNGVLQDYLNAVSGHDSLEVLQRRNISWVLMRPEAPLAYLLEHAPGWSTPYRENNSVLFRKDNP